MQAILSFVLTSPQDSTFYTPNAPQGAEPMQVEIKAPSHPIVVFFHLLFKILALVTYLIGSLVIKGDNKFVLPFIFTTLFLALDFWITKNVSGRLLVGLRWWNEVKEDGTNVWVFESLEKEALIHPFQSKIFWIGVLVFPIIWIILLFVQIILFSWDWAILCALAVALNGANVTGIFFFFLFFRKERQLSRFYDFQRLISNALFSSLFLFFFFCVFFFSFSFFLSFFFFEFL